MISSDRTGGRGLLDCLLITAIGMLLSGFPLTASEGKMKLNMWVEPSAPAGAWKYSGELDERENGIGEGRNEICYRQY